MALERLKSSSLHLACLERLQPPSLSSRARKLAATIDGSYRAGQQIPLLSNRRPLFDQTQAYEVSAALCAHRQASQRYKPVGRKIGFTNQSIWPQYNVSEPNWGYLWDTTCYQYVPEIKLPPHVTRLQPRIEPEIIFCLKSQPHSSMSDREVLSCVEWIAHGFEIVVSLFKDWKFNIADTTAANALHSRLFIGQKKHVHKGNTGTLLSELRTFQIVLSEARGQIETGSGSNVLGSPIKALIHLCGALESQSLHPGLCPGEIISTGTLTNAMPITDGDVWTTTLKGIDLPGLQLPVKELDNSTTEQGGRLKIRKKISKKISKQLRPAVAKPLARQSELHKFAKVSEEIEELGKGIEESRKIVSGRMAG